MSTSSLRHQVHQVVTVAEAETAADIVAGAFTALQQSAWLVPDPEERCAVLANVFRIIVAHAIEYGRVDVVTQSADGTDIGPVGTAVWFHRERPSPPPPDYAERLRLAAGEHTARFEILDDLFDAHHPDEPHHHLALLAVLPMHQRCGIGGRLLRHHHEILESDHTPAYLEASNLESRKLYAEHGYRDRGQAFTLPNGAAFYPMWRDPGTPAARTVD